MVWIFAAVCVMRPKSRPSSTSSAVPFQPLIRPPWRVARVQAEVAGPHIQLPGLRGLARFGQRGVERGFQLALHRVGVACLRASS